MDYECLGKFEQIARALINKIILSQGQLVSRLSFAQHPVSVNFVALRVDVHLWHGVVELHVCFAHSTAILDGLDAAAEVVGRNCA